MKHNLLTRVSFTMLIILFALSVSGWTGNPITVLAAPSDGTWTGTTDGDMQYLLTFLLQEHNGATFP